MNKEIKQHDQFMVGELMKLGKIVDTVERTDKAQTLLAYHDIQVRNFQHERLVHLLVTITFGAIMLLSWVGLLGWLITVGGCWDIIACLLLLLAVILTVLEAAYLRHYYGLENNTQKLYRFNKQLYEEIQ